jgi:hypothetical protein
VSGQVTFPARSVTGATQLIGVRILPDALAEAIDTFACI